MKAIRFPLKQTQNIQIIKRLRRGQSKILSRFILGLSVGAFIFFSGCATMSKKECLTVDWYLKGLEDATQGYPQSRVVEHGKACAKVSIAPNTKEYFAGHAKGTRLYCVPEKGYSEGRRGAAYNDICPDDLERNFLRAYRDGQELYAIERNINNLQSQIESDKSRINYDYDEMAHLKAEVVNSPNENERRRKMQRIDELQMEITNSQIQIDRNYRELDLYEHDFDVVKNKHYRMGYLH